jgi:hypothetical protein
MLHRKIDRGGAGRIMSDKNDLAEPQSLNHRRQVAKLLRKAVGRTGRLLGRAKPQKIKRNDAPAGLGQVRDEVVIDAKIVGKAVHEHESRAGAVIITGVELSLLMGNTMFGESRFAGHDALVVAASEVLGRRVSTGASARRGHFDWIFATSCFLKN